MSRTAHHVPLGRWNQLEHEDDPRPGREGYDWAVGHVVYDLRFFAGCRRRPQKVTASVRGGGYIHGHGGTQVVQVRAREIEGGLRAGWRAFAATAVKTWRAGEDVGELLEPDGRTRHQAVWDLS